jgi:hypothetical protein
MTCKKITRRQKYIASCQYPTAGNFSTWREVNVAKLVARGKFWDNHDFYEYVAFAPDGKRKFFPYVNEWKAEVRICAKLWSMDKKTQAKKLYLSYFDGCLFKEKT